MKAQVDKYLGKLLAHGLVANPHDVGLYGLDDEISTNRPAVPPEVAALFDLLNINSLIVARPHPLLWAVITELLQECPGLICPCDCESLTFIHDIPVVDAFHPGALAAALNRRKGCIVRGQGLVTFGTVSLEQAFVTASSICFATFVKYFADILNGLGGFRDAGRPARPKLERALEILAQCAPSSPASPLSDEAPTDTDAILSAMDEAGRVVVEARLVDSFFGNISFRDEDEVYISQTGSSLDELTGHIDRVFLDGSSTSELTSSSELSAHVEIFKHTGDTLILHGHPRFSVIMSMCGPELAFEERRFVGDVPVVSGEVGAGRRGLVHTLPPAMALGHAAIVHGHGTFVSARGSYAPAFAHLLAIEQDCFRMCRELIEQGLA